MEFNQFPQLNAKSNFFEKPMTKVELAERLGVSQRTLQRWIKRLLQQGELPGYDKQSHYIKQSTAIFLAEKFCI